MNTAAPFILRHNHGPNFGRRVDGCPRCAELAAGAAPIRQDWRNAKREQDAARLRAIRSHDCRASRCGPVCTAFEW